MFNVFDAGVIRLNRTVGTNAKCQTLFFRFGVPAIFPSHSRDKRQTPNTEYTIINAVNKILNILTFCHGVQFWPIFRRLSRKSNWPNVANVCPGNRIGQTSIIHSVWGDENYCTAIDVTTDPPRCSNSPPFTEKQCSL